MYVAHNQVWVPGGERLSRCFRLYAGDAGLIMRKRSRSRSRSRRRRVRGGGSLIYKMYLNLDIYTTI